MGILIEFNTSQAAKSQCYSYEAVLLLQLKSGSTAASRQVERKVGLSGNKKRGEKINTCANFFVGSLLFGCFCKQLAAVVIRSQGTGGMAGIVSSQRKHRNKLLPWPHLVFYSIFLPALFPPSFPFLPGKKIMYCTLVVHFSRMKRLTEISFWDTSGVRSLYMMCILPCCLIKYR